MSTSILAIAVAGAIAGGITPKADPLCYFDRPDGSRENLSALCGGSPATGQGSRVTATEQPVDNETPNARDYARIRVGTMNIFQLEEFLGEGERGRSLNRGGGRSTETAYQWTSPGGNRLGVLLGGQPQRVTAKVYRSRFSRIEQASFAGVGRGGANPVPCMFDWQEKDDGSLCFSGR
ncbi:MAG: hypothetical protein AAGA67_08515 [Cyanobacteria bacterium P01_F01_bin.153]